MKLYWLPVTIILHFEAIWFEDIKKKLADYTFGRAQKSLTKEKAL